MKFNTEDIIVYTSLIGENEGLNKQPYLNQSRIRHVCLTDDKNLKSNDWEIIQVERILPGDPHRSQRNCKLRPHLFFPNYKYSLYLDNTVVLKKDTESFIEYILNNYEYNEKSLFLSIPFHSFRDNLISEFNECSNLNLDDQLKLQEQLYFYLSINSKYLKQKPYWCGVIFRNHNNEKIIKFSEIWFSNVCRYSKRDQLSVIHASKQSKVEIKGFNLDNSASEYHKWPVKNNVRHKIIQKNNFTELIPFYSLDLLERKIKENKILLKEIDNKKNLIKVFFPLKCLNKFILFFKNIYKRLIDFIML